MVRNNHQKRKRTIAAAVILMFILTCLLIPQKAEAGNLKISAGFYGGPYYEVGNYTETDMKNLAGTEIYTYSGIDSGHFARVCYGWGPSLENLINDCNIDLGSVNYLHMKTSDNYGESTTTFSANDLLKSRYYLPNQAREMPSNGQISDFSFSKYGAGAESVPTILAIACTEFSRDEALRINQGGSYKQYSTGDLPKDFQYRLIYGQTDDGSENVQSSGKWVYEMEVQLKGSPGLKIEKKLISGSKDKKGSKYQLTCTVSLPESYSYLSKESLAALKKQVLSNIKVSGYDNSIVSVTGLAEGSMLKDGKCQVEIVGKGDTSMQFSYTRKEYSGQTTASSQAGMTGIGSDDSDNKKDPGNGGGGTGNNDDDKKGNNGTGNKKKGDGSNDQKGDNGNQNQNRGLKIADKKTSNAIAQAENKAFESNDSKNSTGNQWVEFDPENASVDFSSESGLNGLTAAAAGLLLGGGVIGEILFFRRSAGKRSIADIILKRKG
ncbi:MAG: hypothetical protein VB031_01035 [Eubacteriaceae bacterium]|nr:hypothetical protein [Eubacteriaceae bacterium]